MVNLKHTVMNEQMHQEAMSNLAKGNNDTLKELLSVADFLPDDFKDTAKKMIVNQMMANDRVLQQPLEIYK